MPLPAPTTTSPGKLCFVYSTAAVDHEVCTNFADGFDITDADAINDIATDMVPLIAACLMNVCSITAYRVKNPAGITLAEVTLPSAVPGTSAGTVDGIASQSGTTTLTGKGEPAIGLASGQVRFVLFPGYFSQAASNNPKTLLSTMPGFAALKAYLEASAEVGADFYGSFGNWRNYMTTQINAHYQKSLGI